MKYMLNIRVLVIVGFFSFCCTNSLLAQTITETDGNFNLYSNGIVKCTAATDGDTGTLGGLQYTRRTKAEIQADNSLASTSCTSGITDMASMFYLKTTFNEDISTWDVSNVTTMNKMFYGGSVFNQDLSAWDVSSVTDMTSMFHAYYAVSAFNQDLSTWDVSNVTTMQNMFLYAKAFNQDISSWDVSNVTTMYGLFHAAASFNQDISSWVVSSVTDMTKMFYGASAFNQDLSAWNVSSVTTMETMFQGASIFNHDITSWDVSNVTTLKGIFNAASAFNQDISSWDISSVTDMSYMFNNATAFNQDISSWDVSGITDMTSMFSSSAFNQDLSAWDVSSVTSMGYMFRSATTFNQDIGSWDVSSVTSMTSMFNGASTFNQDISAWDVSNLITTGINNMFTDALAFNQDLSSWCLTNITSEPRRGFSTGSLLSTENNPVWGTCPIRAVVRGDAGWRLMSFPFTGATASDISDFIPVQGVSGGDYATSAANFYLYDDSGTFEEPTDVSTAFGDGLGFALYVYDSSVTGASALPVVLDTTATEPSSNVAVTLNPTASGYTLVGNPFASNFSADATNLAVSGADFIQNNIQFWNDGTGSYSTQDRTSPYIINAWQGFWVQLGATGGATTLTFNTSGKTSSAITGQYFSKSIASNRGDINFSLSSSSTHDEAIRLSFRDNATNGYDADDAGKLLPLLSQYAIMGFQSNDLFKSVESLPWDLQEEVTIPMETQLVGVSGGFTLTWNGFDSIPEQWILTFHDYETEVNVDMRVDSLYKFDATAPAAKVNPMDVLTNPEAKLQKSKFTGTRFAITISPTTSVGNETDDKASKFALDQNYPNPFNPTTTINYSVENAGEVNISIYNLMGQKVAELVNGTKASGSYNVTWNASSVSSGMYYYRLEAGGQSITRKMTLIK